MTAGDWLGLAVVTILLVAVAWLTDNPDRKDDQ